jgi:hypothetical protein
VYKPNEIKGLNSKAKVNGPQILLRLRAKVNKNISFTKISCERTTKKVNELNLTSVNKRPKPFNVSTFNIFP